MPDTNTPPVKRYYPTLASVVDTDDIPDFLGFIKDGVISVLNKLHYKDLQYSKSPNGDAAFYSLSILTKERLDFEIPGTGIYLVLNPDLGNNPDFNISVFPITFEYEWKILAFLRGFDLNNFSFSPQEIFEIALRVLNINQEQAIAQFINIFSEPVGQNTSPLDQYVIDLNTKLGTTIPAPTPDTTLQDISEEVYIQTGDYSTMASFSTYIDVPDLDETKAKLKAYFRSLLPNDIEAYIKDLLLPKIKTSLTLSAAIEFPRNILQPVYDINGDNPFDPNDTNNVPLTVIEADTNDDPKVLLSIGEILFYADTEKGFGYDADLILNTNVPAQIGNTGMIIDIQNVKLDLREDRNIPEADADGRPNTFKGAFIEHASITLPEILKKDESNTVGSIVARNLLIGSEGGLSGMVGFEAENLDYTVNFEINVTKDGNGVITDFDGFEFDETTGQMTITGLEKVFINETDESPTEQVKTTIISIPYAGLTVLDSANHQFLITNAGVVTAPDGPTGTLTFKIFDTTIIINDFYLTFNKSKIVASTVTGTIDSPGLDSPLNMTVDFSNGFRIHVYNSNGVQAIDNDFFTLTLTDLELGRIDEKIFLGISGALTNNINIPFVNKFIPNEISFDPIKWTQTEGFDYNIGLKWLNGIKFNFSNENPPELEAQHIYFPILQEKEEGFFKLKGLDIKILAGENDNSQETLDLSVVFDGASFNFKDFITLTIDGMGFTTLLTDVTPPDPNAALPPADIGPFDIDFGFIPPKGIGLSVNTKSVTGGGYLFFDFDAGKFVGAGEITINDELSLKVIGILLTKLPDNPDGYSLLLMVTAEGFSAVPLGFGFKLTGVGGLVALHRTMNLQALRDGVKNKTLDNILFPDNPIRDIALIVTDLERVFPVQEGRHTFGLMGQVIWGKPKLITMEVGLMIEVPSPIKIAVLGVIKSKLPTEDDDVLRLQVNFVGTIDFGAKYITFDASIFDSRFATFTISGDMAFRLKWGNEPNFLLSVGGFHPAYTPPPLDLPTLERIKINLLGKDNPRLTLSAYFAVTSNTVQFGSLLDFYYKVTNKISVVGNLGFDILLQFSPFYLKAELYAMLAVIRNGKALTSVNLSASLEGPEPWHAMGKAEFTVLELNLSANFDETFGDEVNTTLPDVDVWPKLVEAANNHENWDVEAPPEAHQLVTLREPELADDVILIHPNGNLTFDQKIVPLNVSINKFGKQSPINHTRFTMSMAIPGEPDDLESNTTKEFFAPASFFDMTDSQKIARKSFERMDSGLKVTQNKQYFSTYFGNFKLEYENIVYDTRDNRSVENPFAEKPTVFQAMINNNAVSNSALGQTQQTSYQAPDPIHLSQESFAIANLDDLSMYSHLGEDQAFASEAEAKIALETLIINHPALINSIDVVAAYELV